MAKKIMIVEDDPVIVKYLQQLFEDNGYETCSAEDGAQAYDVMVKEKPDLITLDLEMPGDWGTKFYRKMTKNKEFKDIPVMVISGMASRHLSIKKAIAYLSKPFDPDKVLGIVKSTIG